MSPGPSLPEIDLRAHAFYLDFDGTLAPIVAQPHMAALSPSTEALLRRLCALTQGAVALLSGRALSDLDRRIAPLRLAASGSHGLALRASAEGDEEHAEAPDLAALADGLAEIAQSSGVRLEQKPGALALHYRAAPDQADACRAAVDRLADANPGLRALHGKMVSELALAGIDKGTALTSLHRRAPFAGRIPIMVGDDVTDEDGFAAAQQLGGAGIKIGSGDSRARYRAESMDSFLGWLERQVGAQDGKQQKE